MCVGYMYVCYVSRLPSETSTITRKHILQANLVFDARQTAVVCFSRCLKIWKSFITFKVSDSCLYCEAAAPASSRNDLVKLYFHNVDWHALSKLLDHLNEDRETPMAAFNSRELIHQPWSSTWTTWRSTQARTVTLARQMKGHTELLLTQHRNKACWVTIWAETHCLMKPRSELADTQPSMKL